MQSPAQQARNRLGGLSNAAQNDTRATTAAARQTFRESFDKKVDPEGILSPAERARRSAAAYAAHFTSMRLASLRTRRKNAAKKA